MNVMIQILLSLIAVFFAWRIYQTLKANPEMLSKANITSSFSTMGVLALILIGFVGIMVLLLRA